MKFALISALLLSTMVVSKESAGKCPTYTATPNFNADAYVGRWYEYRRDAGTIFEWLSDCVTATYKIKANGNVEVYNRAWYWYIFFSYVTALGEA